MLLGLDQGTSSTRACLVDDAGRIVVQAAVPHAQHHPHPGWVEHDLDEIWAATERVLADVVARGERPAGLALANQGETVALWHARTLRPLHRALVWQDTRTEAMIARLAADPAVAARVTAETGLRLDSYFSASKLAWLLDHAPGARALADAGQLRAGTLDTYLIARLTGGDVFATDASTAARTLLADTRTHAWSPWLASLFGIPPQVLPEIRDSDAGFGACTLPGLDGVPIVASLVDQPAALIGQGCVAAGDTKATFGTGAFVYANTGERRPEPAHGTLATVAWRRAGTATYALDGGVLAVGSTLDWLRALGCLREGESVDAAVAARSDPAVTCVPALAGLGAPHWDRDARAAWLGLSAATTRGDLVGAALDGIACRVAEVVTAIEGDAGMTISELSAGGGLARSSVLMQLVADVLGRPVVVAEEDEATAVGACALAALRLGQLTLADVRARRGRSRSRYEPTWSADARDALRDRFGRALAVARER